MSLCRILLFILLNKFAYQVQKATGILPQHQLITLNNATKLPTNSEAKLATIPGLQDGAIITLDNKGPPIESTIPVQAAPSQKPPTAPPAPPTEEKYLKKVEAKSIVTVQAPTGRTGVVGRVDVEGAKHLSFDEYVDRKFAKSRTLNPNQKTLSSLLDVGVEAAVKSKTSHLLPPSINVRRQEYRHVDYAEFMNFTEVSRFIKNWLETGYQRAGVLYGYYAEDPIYEKGVRAIVEVLYEPPQENKYNETVLLDDPNQSQLDQIVHNLGFERLGYLFTTFNKSAFLTNQEFLLAGKMQEAHSIQHPIGVQVSKQITVVLRGCLSSRS